MNNEHECLESPYWRQGEWSPTCNPSVCQLPLGIPRCLWSTPRGREQGLIQPITARPSCDVTPSGGATSLAFGWTVLFSLLLNELNKAHVIH